MTKEEINLIAQRNREFIGQGRLEGAAMALFGMLLYLILVAAIL